MKNVLSFFSIKNLIKKSSLTLDFVQNIMFHPDILSKFSNISTDILTVMHVEQYVMNKLFNDSIEAVKNSSPDMYTNYKLTVPVILKPKYFTSYFDPFAESAFRRKCNRFLNKLIAPKKKLYQKNKIYTIDIPYVFNFKLQNDEHYYIELVVADSFNKKHDNDTFIIVNNIIPIFTKHKMQSVTIIPTKDIVLSDLEFVFDLYISITRGS